MKARIAVGLILLASYAFFWQARDWNGASRLMLTYALVDRGTLSIDGLETQTRDIARYRGRFYTDKMPGFSLLAIPPYILAKVALGLPDHPLHAPAMTHWPADPWVTLGTSGLLTACAGALLAMLAGELGCGPRRSALVGLTYGLATPAYAYATLSYGHQPTSFALLAAFALLRKAEGRRATVRAGLAGLLASLAAVIELQVGPVSAALGLYALARTIGGRMPWPALGTFALGALAGSLVLLGYNALAFESPWDMGYFHLIMDRFAQVHSAENPLGLRRPDWSRAPALIWGGYRGLLFYAPILILAVPGWIVLVARRWYGTAAVSASACLAVFLVNLSYPEWTGGWTTGPRLLVPLLPFAMLPVAGMLAVGGRSVTILAAGLTLAGGVLILLFVGVGARVPQYIPDPLAGAVWPLWRGDPLPTGWVGDRFARNLISIAWPGAIGRLPAVWRWVQFVPLLVFQAVAIAALMMTIRAPVKPPMAECPPTV